MPIGKEWFWVCSIGVLGLIGQVLLTRAFQLADTSTVAPIKYMELVYALLFGFILFGETYAFWPVVGIILVVIGMLLNLWIKKKEIVKE